MFDVSLKQGGVRGIVGRFLSNVCCNAVGCKIVPENQEDETSQILRREKFAIYCRAMWEENGENLNKEMFFSTCNSFKHGSFMAADTHRQFSSISGVYCTKLKPAFPFG